MSSITSALMKRAYHIFFAVAFTLLAAASFLNAQTYNHILDIIPQAGTRGEVDIYDSTQTHFIGVKAPSSMGANTSLTLPVPGSIGCVQDTAGSGVLTIAACAAASLTPPVTISGSSASPTLTLNQTGAGLVLNVSGGSTQFTSADPLSTMNVGNTGSGLALSTSGGVNIGGTEAVSGLLSLGVSSNGPAIQQASGTWYLTGTGVGYFHDVVSRNVFNSIGDIPLAGAVNTSGTTVNWVSGDVFDISMVGGQILICPGGCTGTNGSLFTIASWVSLTQITLTTTPGTLTSAGYSYQANAFQTSTGRMQITGTGDGLFQTAVVTNGFTSNGGGALSGTATWSGNDVLWASGSKFNPSMVGGSITVGATTTRVTGFVRDTHVTVLASLGSSSGSFSITPNAFQTSNGNVQVDSSGNAAFGGALKDTGGIINITSSGSSAYTATGSSGSPASLMLAGNNSTNCWQNQANGSGSSLILGYTSSCGSAFSPTTEVTFTPSGTTFALPIVVPSCSGCGGITYSGGTGINITGSVISNTGVASFNTRTGAVTLTASDVTAAGATNTFAVTSFSDSTLIATASTFSTASLFLHGNNNTNCWDTGAGTGAALVLRYASGCSGAYSPTTEVTFASTGTTFAQPISVPSCTGCGSGVSSFNSRTGAVSLTKADVTAVTQALGTSDAVTFGGVTATAGFAVPGWGFVNSSGWLASGNGANCSGAPTASFATVFGIVTHC